MPNHRISKKQMQKNYIRQFNEMKCCIKHQEEMMNGLFEQMDRQKEILNLYYKEYQEMKRRQEKQYLMTYIRMRESMLRDMEVYEQRQQTHTQGYRLLSMYVNEYTDMLEERGVEIVECQTEEAFNPEIQKPIERIRVDREEYDNMVCKVYSSGYRWHGFVLKKIDVAVGIYK